MIRNNYIYKITIPNFFVHNKKRSKSFTHFMFAKNYFSDHKIAQLTPIQSLLYIYLLSVCCDFASDCILITTCSLPKSLHIDTKLDLFMETLQSLQLLTYEKNNSLDTSKVKISKVKKIKVNNICPTSRSDDLDFDQAYNQYPKKEGKSRGLKICTQQIKTEQQLQSLIVAINNYALKCKNDKIDYKFIKQFSTFMNEWKDWLEYQPQRTKMTLDDWIPEEEIQRLAELEK